MYYPTYIIEKKEDIVSCPVFDADNFLWTCKTRPKTFGQMGYISGTGLYLTMTCLEQDPKREMKNHRDMVCYDSAVEAFFAFPDSNLRQTERPENNCLYFNFEINALGAMYAKYGCGRQNRLFITKKEYEMAQVSAVIEKDRWSAELIIPDKLLARTAGICGFSAGDKFFCNFYKISQHKPIEHYAAFAPIPTNEPNFHQPEFFAISEIVCHPTFKQKKQ